MPWLPGGTEGQKRGQPGQPAESAAGPVGLGPARPAQRLSFMPSRGQARAHTPLPFPFPSGAAQPGRGPHDPSHHHPLERPLEPQLLPILLPEVFPWRTPPFPSRWRHCLCESGLSPPWSSLVTRCQGRKELLFCSHQLWVPFMVLRFSAPTSWPEISVGCLCLIRTRLFPGNAYKAPMCSQPCPVPGPQEKTNASPVRSRP